MASYHTGDTIRVAATYRDWSSDGTGDLVDPDTVEVTVFDSDWAELDGPTWPEAATNESVGVWYYDFVFPDTSGSFYIEFSAVKDSLPIVKRLKVSSRQIGDS